MRNVFLIFLFLTLSLLVKAQTNSSYTLIKGIIKSCKNDVSLSYAHVVNESTHLSYLADVSGNYSAYVKQGDLIRITYLGYKTRFFEYHPVTFNTEICLSQDTILLKEVVALPFSNYTEFKQQFLSIKTEEKEYVIPGITLKERTTIHNLENENYVKSLGFALSSPLSALYYNFSRREKNIRKYHELENNKWIQIDIDKKYNRQIVSALTGLKDEKLTHFMTWCRFDKDFLKTATDLEIALKVKEKFLLYCENK